ncbi:MULTISPECIES: type II toxin-antitoxin system ParD family antitoxin [unclassified Mesorhizobium]|uniref:type II toxin-antitoxin system ParD family antitoxin n=1 Tax=unclassified Mesorhizobium TaxID=325217 RepID=UPI001CCE9BA8|nr:MULTISPECIES: type II toxin-antitoxin system ParD family antitoxin [unclassified Mesorhizobium]MBZ9738308.1 type II toxin-antitoxin system ParD family antitoxin [Mesorhizobium sp. CO1-1-4]MBZ9800891.1 type II toxin-antitoxin system ParD family antitoxin [Mesorhizobium sp. ES1-6]
MESAEKLSVTVTPAMARMIREKVEDGSFGSASEVIRAALRAFQREEEEHAERMAAIRARVKASIEDTRPGVPLDEAIERVRKRISGLAGER